MSAISSAMTAKVFPIVAMRWSWTYRSVIAPVARATIAMATIRIDSQAYRGRSSDVLIASLRFLVSRAFLPQFFPSIHPATGSKTKTLGYSGFIGVRVIKLEQIRRVIRPNGLFHCCLVAGIKISA